MRYVITHHTPICPKCQSGMKRSHRTDGFYYICNDHPEHIFYEIGSGQAECESIVVDNINDILEDEDGKI